MALPGVCPLKQVPTDLLREKSAEEQACCPCWHTFECRSCLSSVMDKFGRFPERLQILLLNFHRSLAESHVKRLGRAALQNIRLQMSPANFTTGSPRQCVQTCLMLENHVLHGNGSFDTMMITDLGNNPEKKSALDLGQPRFVPLRGNAPRKMFLQKMSADLPNNFLGTGFLLSREYPMTRALTWSHFPRLCKSSGWVLSLFLRNSCKAVPA